MQTFRVYRVFVSAIAYTHLIVICYLLVSNENHMDIIYLRDLKVDAVIGIYGWERQVRQAIVLDLEMATDIKKAASTDDIKDTLNYKGVAKRIIDFVSHSEFGLVETLAERVAEIVLTEFDVPWVRLRLNKKGAVRGARDVGIIIERGAKPA